MGVRRKKRKGYVYVLSNKCMPGLYKVGYTTRDVAARAREISGATGVPIPFNIERAYPVANAKAIEASVHNKLDKYRINKKREFFQVSERTLYKNIEYAIRNHRVSNRASKTLWFVLTALCGISLAGLVYLLKHPDLSLEIRHALTGLLR